MRDRKNRDFLLACRRVISKSDGNLTASQVAYKASRTETPVFYVSYDYALRRVRALRRRGASAEDAPGAAGVFGELRRRMERRMRRTGERDRDALAIVLAEGRAPRFYLTPRAATTLYYSLRTRAAGRRSLRHHRHPAPAAGTAK